MTESTYEGGLLPYRVKKLEERVDKFEQKIDRVQATLNKLLFALATGSIGISLSVLIASGKL